ncbi:MAG: archease [Thermodesulfobacteriota bacterium]
MTISYILLDHTADLGIRVTARTEEGLYTNAVLALADLLSGPLSRSGARPLSLAASGEDRSEMLINLLREQLYLFTGEKLLVAGVEGLALSPGSLEARVLAVPYNPEVHEIRHWIKAVTWHQAEAEQRGGVWEARVIFDV